MQTSIKELADGRVVLELWPLRGAPLLFYPGSMLEPGHYRLLLNELSLAGFSVCALHLPGHGRNEAALQSFEDLLDLGICAEKWLARRCHEKVALCGHSQGGILAMAHAARSSSVSACFSICSVFPHMEGAIKLTRFSRLARHRLKIMSFIRRLAKAVPGLPVFLPLYLSMNRLLKGRKKPLFYGSGKGPASYSLKFIYSLFAAEIKYPLSVPFWLMSAKNDVLFLPDIVEETFALAKPPVGNIVWLPDGGHLAVFNPQIAAFVARTCASSMASLGYFLYLRLPPSLRIR